MIVMIGKDIIAIKVMIATMGNRNLRKLIRMVVNFEPTSPIAIGPTEHVTIQAHNVLLEGEQGGAKQMPLSKIR